MRNLERRAVVLSCLLAITACTSSSDSTPAPESDALTAATGVALSVSQRSLDFSWTAGANVDHYRISVNADGASGFNVEPTATHVAATATSFSIEAPVHQTNWLAAQYIVEACDATEANCIASPNQTLAPIDSVAATIYAKASNTDAGDEFGWNVSLSDDGNTLAVSAHLEGSAAMGVNGNQADNTLNGAGAVYVFVRTGATWSQQAYVKSGAPANGDSFGMEISLSGDGQTLAVGTADRINGTFGAVYIYARAGSLWAQQAYVQASNAEVSDRFGMSLSLSGDGNTLVVGADGEDSSTTGIGSVPDNLALWAGAAYVFTRTGSVWTEQAYIKASNASADDVFGTSVSLSGDGNTLAVSAIGESSAALGVNGNELDNTSSWSGAVYVFSRTASVWTQQAYVKASNTGMSDEFGSSVSLRNDGNALAVGAVFEASVATGINGNEADNSLAAAGAAYVFGRTGGVWAQQAYVKASNTGGDNFGGSVSLSGDGKVLAVGAFLEDSVAQGVAGDALDDTAANAGAAYTFVNSGGSWVQEAYVKASNTSAGNDFGISVGLNIDGSSLVVGSTLEDSLATGMNGNQAAVIGSTNAGAVYLY